MKFFHKKKENKNSTIVIHGYEIDLETGILLHCPKGLKKYVIPKEVQSISTTAKVDMRSSAEEIEFEVGTNGISNITVIQGQEFSFFRNLKKVKFPEGLKELGKAFDPIEVDFNLPTTLEVTHIVPMFGEKIIIPNTIKEFRGGISHNTHINYIEIAGSINHLNVDTVRQCKFLETLVLKEGIQSMNGNAISGVNHLVNIEIPDSLKMFYLGADDARPMNGTHGAKDYNSNEESERQRILKIKKTIDNIQYNFEITRSDFHSLSVIDNKIIFGKDQNCFEIDRTVLTPNQTYIIDMQNRKIILKETIYNPQQHSQSKVMYSDIHFRVLKEKSNSLIEKYNKSISELMISQTKIENIGIYLKTKEI